jgi:hypothetical protein
VAKAGVSGDALFMSVVEKVSEKIAEGHLERVLVELKAVKRRCWLRLDHSWESTVEPIRDFQTR